MDKVKFVSYTGRYPNLCSGVLTLEIEGKRVTFGPTSGKLYFGKSYDDPDYPSFWESGGCVRYSEDDRNFLVEQGRWIINKKDIPYQYQKYMKEIRRLFNEYVPYGCCGGCI